MDRTELLFDERYKKLKRSSKVYENLYKHNKTPLTMSILVTNRCSLKCKHCFNHVNENNSKDEVSLENFEKISESMGTFMKAFFSGGEPFMRKDLKDIILMFVSNNNLMHISITTNGQLKNEVFEQISYILNHVDESVHVSLGFSLDGFESTHNLIRGKGTFKKSLDTWWKCKELAKKYKNFDMYTCSTINLLNENEMSEFLEWCINELEPASVALLKIRQNPRDGNYLKKISLQNYIDSANVIKEAIINGKLGDRSEPNTYINTQACDYVHDTVVENKRKFECFAGKYGGFINYNGDVGICEVMRPYANLRNYDFNFQELWTEMLDKRKIDKKCENCIICTHETEGIIPSLFFGNNEIKYLKKDKS